MFCFDAENLCVWRGFSKQPGNADKKIEDGGKLNTKCFALCLKFNNECLCVRLQVRRIGRDKAIKSTVMRYTLCGLYIFSFLFHTHTNKIFYGELNDTKKEELSHSMPLYSVIRHVLLYFAFISFKRKGKGRKNWILFLYQHNRQQSSTQVKAKDHSDTY